MSALASTSLACCHAAHACWEDRLPVLHTPHNTCVLSSSRPREAARAWTRKLPILTHFSNLAPEGRPPCRRQWHIMCVHCENTSRCRPRPWPLSRTKCPDGFAEAEVSERAAFFCSLLCRRCIYSCLDPLYRTFPASFLLSVDHSIAARSLTFPHPHREEGMILHGLSSKEGEENRLRPSSRNVYLQVG